MQDIETIVQYIQLRNATAHPVLLDPEPVATQLARLRRGFSRAKRLSGLQTWGVCIEWCKTFC